MALSEAGSPPSSPLAPNERIYKPLPKRSRLSSDSARPDHDTLPTWAHGAAAMNAGSVEDDLHPALDTATSSTENDGDGPPTPPQNNLDPLNFSSIFSSVHHLVKDAAAATTLFGAAAAEIGSDTASIPPARRARDERDADDDGPAEADDTGPPRYGAQNNTTGQLTRLAAAAGLLGDPGELREEEDLRVDERDRDDDYGSRRGGANKKKRKVPSAANGHNFAASPPGSPTPLPAPSSVHGVGGLSREQDTGMRANFATAMVGVVKAMGTLAAGRGGPQGTRVPHSSHRRRRDHFQIRPSTKDNLPSDVPPPKAKVWKKGGKVVEPLVDTQIQLANLYDPALGPAVPSPAAAEGALVRTGKKQTQQPIAEPVYRFYMPEGEFLFDSPPPKMIATRIIELERERMKLRRAKELILERARELENVRQRALEEDAKAKKLLPPGKNGKILVEHAMQTDGPEGGREVWITPRTVPAPSNAPKKPPPRKGKKKRSAHANANNVHHRDNYVPSRPVRSPVMQTTPSTAVPLLRPGASLDLVDPNSPFYAPGPEAHPQLGISMLAPFFAGADEWLCSFCESRILYGTQSNVSEAVRKRKGVLKVRKRAQERAAKAASGQATGTSSKAPRGKLPRAVTTHDIACGPGDDAAEEA